VITAHVRGPVLQHRRDDAALPHTGGAYSFARSAMGPWGAYVTGLAENMEYILTPPVIVVGIGGYLCAITGHPDRAGAAARLARHLRRVRRAQRGGRRGDVPFTVFITAVALAILAVFYVGAIPHFDLANARTPGDAPWFPHGAGGVLAALPFAIWFYLAIEQLPLAAEEAHAPERDLPRGIVLGLATLIACSFGTLVLSAGIRPVPRHSRRAGAAVRRPACDPGRPRRRAGARAGSGRGSGRELPYDRVRLRRQIYSLSRAGYFPRWLSVTGRRRTPHRALWIGAALGYAVTLAVYALGPKHPVGAVLLNLAGVRSGDLVRAADALVHPAADPAARDRATLPQPARRPRARRRPRDRARVARSLFASDPVYRGVAVASRGSGTRWACSTSRSGAATGS
jgi:ethanolamine permease